MFTTFPAHLNQTFQPKAKQQRFVITEENLNRFIDAQDSQISTQSLLIDILNGKTTASQIRSKIEATEALNDEVNEEG